MSERRGSAVDSRLPKTVYVPHLGGIDVSYRLAKPFRQTKPTLIMVNPFLSSSELYRPQFQNTQLSEMLNLIAIDPLGHGDTRARATENFTYWDSAVMIWQTMDALGVKKAFLLGTSQGGWIVTRVALYAPERIAGLVVLGTAMDYDNERLTKAGCWDPRSVVPPMIENFSKPVPSTFELPDEFCNMVVDNGFGKDCPQEARELWVGILKKNYRGDPGRKRLHQAAINLLERDGLHHRLPAIKCPVLWLQGDADVVYSVENANHEIKLFTNSSDARVIVVNGGHHYLSWTHAEEVNSALLEFVGKYQKGEKPDARALREAVGMVDI